MSRRAARLLARAGRVGSYDPAVKGAGLVRRDASGIFIMLLSAAIFGYFGFGTSWTHHSVIDGRFLLFVAILDYTLKATAMAFLAAAVLAMVSAVGGSLLFAVAGLISALLFLVVAVMDWLDTQHTAVHPLLLLVFAAWNGYGAWTSLTAMAGQRQARDDLISA